MAIVDIKELFKDEKAKENFVFTFPTPPIASSGGFKSGPVIVPVDATLSETYTLSANITQNEIQDGNILSDHIHILPEKISLRCVISEAPVFFLSGVVRGLVDLGTSESLGIFSGETKRDSFSSRLAPVLGGIEKYARELGSGQVSGFLLGENSRKGIQKTFWEQYLKKNFLAKKPFKITSGLQTINNVFFSNITFKRTLEIGDSLAFDCVLQEIRLISQNTIITAGAPQAQRSENRGHQSTRLFNTGNIFSSARDRITGALGIGGGGEADTGTQQEFPSLPFLSRSQIRDRIPTSLKQAKDKTLRFLGGLF